MSFLTLVHCQPAMICRQPNHQFVVNRQFAVNWRLFAFVKVIIVNHGRGVRIYFVLIYDSRRLRKCHYGILLRCSRHHCCCYHQRNHLCCRCHHCCCCSRQFCHRYIAIKPVLCRQCCNSITIVACLRADSKR